MRPRPGFSEPMRPRPGFTLAETMVSMFMLFSAFVVFAALLHSTMSSTTRAQMRAQAAMVAQRKLDELRDWAAQKPGSSYNFDGSWAAFAAWTTDPAYPGFEVRAVAQAVTVSSPCTQLDLANPANLRKPMPGSAMRVVVTVRWDPADVTKRVIVVSLIGAPTRGVRGATPVVVTPKAPLPAQVVKNGSVDFAAAVYDVDDQEIPDVAFRWYVLPRTGNGTVEPILGLGQEATFTHTIYRPDGSRAPVTGLDSTGNPRTCQLQVRTRYHGREYWGISDVITLQP